jgi:hypothetical protein
METKKNMSNRHQVIEQLETINNLPYEVTNAQALSNTQRSNEWFKDRYGKIKVKKLLYVK